MSLDEAVELVLFALKHGNSGDLFKSKHRPELLVISSGSERTL
jgi:FlaA1/EpsC-like NDP-sugar epimerase